MTNYSTLRRSLSVKTYKGCKCRSVGAIVLRTIEKFVGTESDEIKDIKDTRIEGKTVRNIL